MCEGAQQMSASDVVAGRVRAQRHYGRERIVYPLTVICLAAAYYGAAELGYALEVAGPVAAIVWLPVGVAIAFLYLGGSQLWPGVVIGDLLANDYGMLPLGTALTQTFGNLLEVLVAVALLRRVARNGPPLDSIGSLMGMLGALAAGTAVSATVGALAQRVGGVLDGGELLTVWRTWWLGDFTGALVIVPLALAWYRPLPRHWWRERRVEAVVLLFALLALSEFASSSHEPLVYIIFPALIWAGLRFGQRGATLAVVIVVGFLAWNASHYLGPFLYWSITDGVLNTQLFIAVAALTTFSLAAVVSEREAFGEGLRASRARLVEASDTERRRIVRNLHDGAQQRLSALAVHLRLAVDHRPPPDETAALLERAGDELSLAIEELRELAHGLPPAVLTKLGLSGAIRSIAVRSTVPITLLALPPSRLDDTAEATAYYVIAESVTNAQRYSHASGIEVRAVLAHRVLEVTVADDGVGGATERMSSGLQGLRDRVEAIGGEFELDSPADQGTRVTAAIPALRV
jgi:signal transduction histidine kinase